MKAQGAPRQALAKISKQIQDTCKKPTSSSFISLDTKTGQLMNGNDEFRVTGPNIYWLGLDQNDDQGNGNYIEYPSSRRIRDALISAKELGANTVRCHTLGVSSGGPKTLYPNLDGSFNDTAFITIDNVIKIAKELDLKLIIPLTDAYNYYHGGYYNFCESCDDDSLSKYPWDMTPGCKEFFIVDSSSNSRFTEYIKYVLDHKPDGSDVALKDEPCILAWETGNELQITDWTDASGMQQDWASTWTIYIATYIKKTCGAKQLVMDGRDMWQQQGQIDPSNNKPIDWTTKNSANYPLENDPYLTEVLNCEYICIFTDHLYNTWVNPDNNKCDICYFMTRINNAANFFHSGTKKKAYILGEWAALQVFANEKTTTNCAIDSSCNYYNDIVDTVDCSGCINLWDAAGIFSFLENTENLNGDLWWSLESHSDFCTDSSGDVIINCDRGFIYHPEAYNQAITINYSSDSWDPNWSVYFPDLLVTLRNHSYNMQNSPTAPSFKKPFSLNASLSSDNELTWSGCVPANGSNNPPGAYYKIFDISSGTFYLDSSESRIYSDFDTPIGDLPASTYKVYSYAPDGSLFSSSNSVIIS